jgi:uncharacterized protein YbjT (DUF2867 family)
MDRKSKTVVVLGGTGHYGRQVVRNLVADGQTVRVLSRHPDSAREKLGSQVDIIAGDLVDGTSVPAALDGADAMVVCVSAFSRKLIRRLREIEVDGVLAAFDAAEKAGVKRVVYLSVYELDLDFAARYGQVLAPMKKQVEDALASSSLNWTVFGAPPAMDIFFAFIRGTKLMVPGGGPPALPTISVHDVGTILAQAAVREDLGGQRFRLAGPEPMSFPEAADRIGRIWDMNIKFKKVPLAIPRIVGSVVGVFVPYVGQIARSLCMLNNFPQRLVDDIPADHQRLRETFDYIPLTINDEAGLRKPGDKISHG